MLKILTVGRIVFVCTALTVLPFQTSLADCGTVELTETDKKIFERIDKIEQSANSVSRLLAWAPIINVLTLSLIHI